MRGLKAGAWEWEGAEVWEGARRLQEPWSGRVQAHGMGELDRGLGGAGV